MVITRSFAVGTLTMVLKKCDTFLHNGYHIPKSPNDRVIERQDERQTLRISFIFSKVP